MTYFHIEIDNKFNQFIKSKKNFNKTDLIQLKSFIYEVYQKENSIEEIKINNAFKKLDYKI